MQKFISVIFVFFVLSVSALALAEELTVRIYTSDQMDDFDPGHVVREFVYEEPSYSAFFVKGFSRDAEKKVDLVSGMTFIDPNGNVLFEQENYATLNVEVPDDARFVILNNSFDAILEEGDPLGMYTIEVDVKDNISGLTGTGETTLLIFDTQESKKLIMAPVTSAADLDNLWAEYFRSKNPWAVKRIISALSLRKKSPALDDAIVGGTAQWSLEQNAKQHPEVLRICRQSLEEVEGTTHELLKEIIDNVGK